VQVIEFGTRRDMGGHASFVSTEAIKTILRRSSRSFVRVRYIIRALAGRASGMLSGLREDNVYRITPPLITRLLFCLLAIFQGRRTGCCNLRVPIRLRRTHPNSANEFILTRERQPPIISTKPAVTAPTRPL
jgi:hypothetical protein